MTQMRFFSAIVFVVCTLVFLLTAGSVMADDNITIARILNGFYDDFTFSGDAGQILFAEITSECYQSEGRMGGDHSDSSGGCSDADSSGSFDSESTGSCSDDDSSSGCSCDDDSDGGRQDLCLQVLDADGNKICWAGRPVRPGWQRDPRLACSLPYEGTYILRVFIGQCGSTDTTDYTDVDSLDSVRFYQLYVKLIDEIEDGDQILVPKEKK